MLLAPIDEVHAHPRLPRRAHPGTAHRPGLPAVLPGTSTRNPAKALTSASPHPTPTTGAAPTDNERSPPAPDPFQTAKPLPSYTTLAHGSRIDYISYEGGNQDRQGQPNHSGGVSRRQPIPAGTTYVSVSYNPPMKDRRMAPTGCHTQPRFGLD